MNANDIIQPRLDSDNASPLANAALEKIAMLFMQWVDIAPRLMGFPLRIISLGQCL